MIDDSMPDDAQQVLFFELLAAIAEHERQAALIELVAIADDVAPALVSMTKQ